MDVIVSHVNADFDGLGGMIGAARLYPGAVMVLPGGESPAVRDFLSLHREVFQPRPPAAIDPEAIRRIVVVDTLSRKRLGPAAEWLDRPGVEVHLYDHHPGETDIPATEECRELLGSVCALIAERLRERGVVPTPTEATAMLLGIYVDTGSLLFGGTTPRDLEAAAWLMSQGGDLQVVAEFGQPSLTAEQRELLRALEDGLERREVRGVSVVIAAAPPGEYVADAAVLVSRLIDIESAAAAFALLPCEDRMDVIGRSRSDHVDAAAVLRELGGGGHPRAASAVVRGRTAAEVRDRLAELLDRHVAGEQTAGQIMSFPVRTISPDASIAEARRRMVRYGHSGLVVMDGRRLAGIITRRDVDKARHHRLEHSPVRSVMSREVQTVAPEAPLPELERTMIAAGIGRLPVLRDGALLGIVTRTDVLRALYGSRYLAGTPPVREESVPAMLRERLPAPVQRLLEQIGALAEREGSEAYVVGGFVRDLLLDLRDHLDLDIMVEPDGAALAAVLASEGGGELKRHAQFGTAQVILPGNLKVDFATARTESYAHPGALPDVEPSSIVDDLRRRDFTFNAMAVALRPERFGELLDPFGGRADLDRRRVRALHNLSFIEDPTRVLRAVRLEQRLGFRMDAQTEELARDAIRGNALASISPERLRRELFLMLDEARAFGALLRLEDLGILTWLHPDLTLDQELVRGVRDGLEWWKDAAGTRADSHLAYLAAILAPAGAAEAARTAETRLRLAPAQAKIVEQAVGAIREPERFLQGAAPSAVADRLRGLHPEALALLRARAAGDGEDEKRRHLLDRYVRESRKIRLEITGEDLKALGYPAGPRLGAALRATLQQKVEGGVSGRDAELAFARAFLGPVSPDAAGK